MNSYTLLDGRVVADPETITLKDGKTLCKIRLADNPSGAKDEKRPARFVAAKAFGAQGLALARLAKGNVISVTGQLGVEAYTAKDGSPKTADVLMVSAFRVHKSESFFGKSDKPAPAEPGGDNLDDLFGGGR